jgi:hypothetical protein
MLRAIKDEHLAADSLGGDHVGVVRHVAGAIDLARVVDPLDDGDARSGWYGVAAELAPGLVVGGLREVDCAAAAGGRAFGDLDGGDLEVVLCLSRSVRSQEESVPRVRSTWGSSKSGGGSEARKKKGVAPHDSLSGNH